MKHLKLTINGIVQGVGFRWYAKTEARRFGIVGYASNLPNGTVEILACGREDNVCQYLNAIRIGTNGSHITSIEQEEIQLPICPSDFQIR